MIESERNVSPSNPPCTPPFSPLELISSSSVDPLSLLPSPIINRSTIPMTSKQSQVHSLLGSYALDVLSLDKRPVAIIDNVYAPGAGIRRSSAILQKMSAASQPIPLCHNAMLAFADAALFKNERWKERVDGCGNSGTRGNWASGLWTEDMARQILTVDCPALVKVDVHGAGGSREGASRRKVEIRVTEVGGRRARAVVVEGLEETDGVMLGGNWDCTRRTGGDVPPVGFLIPPAQSLVVNGTASEGRNQLIRKDVAGKETSGGTKRPIKRRSHQENGIRKPNPSSKLPTEQAQRQGSKRHRQIPRATWGSGKAHRYSDIGPTSGREELLQAEIRKRIEQEVRQRELKRTIEMQNLLEQRTMELRESELLFTKAAETIPVGLVLVDPEGNAIFANETYHELTTCPRRKDGKINWRDIIYAEDREHVYKTFDEAIATRSSARWEARIGNEYGEHGWKHWVACNMVVHKSQSTDSPQFQGYMLTLADITHIKLAEEYQRQMSAQAMEKRRQQENFIDIFSHELRNPFSATLQCADGILASVTEYQLKGGELDVDDIASAASTILVCVQHQMRIINDVLTLSKLDSMLLSVTPVDVQIHESIMTTLKIFQSELQVKGIKATYVMNESYQSLGVDWLKCDPSRFNQILVNLLTNAIKFTSLQCGSREISVCLDASLERPTSLGPVSYIDAQGEDPIDSSVNTPEEAEAETMLNGDEWGNGEPVYIHVTVKDSGIGISKQWQKKLFNRFEQVPKTHVTYGGSGLGLFICRKLCRLQGGKIGVFSEEGKGSTFAFYIKARRTTPPTTTATSTRRPSTGPTRELEAASTAGGAPSSQAEPMHKLVKPGTMMCTTIATGAPMGPDVAAAPVGSDIDVYSCTSTRSCSPTNALSQAPMLMPPRPRRIPSSTSLHPGCATSGPGPNPSESAFVPHPSTSPAVQSALKAFKPLKSPTLGPSRHASPQCAPYRVLIVEDNLINQEVLRRQLRKQGCVAHVANNGKEGLEFVNKSVFAEDGGTQIDIVLMDMEMPVMDGNTATRMIRQLEREGQLRKHVPIMGISANARSEQVAEMTKAGMDDVISKPFRIVDLIARLTQLLGKFNNNGTSCITGSNSTTPSAPSSPISPTAAQSMHGALALPPSPAGIATEGSSPHSVSERQSETVGRF
ncbi:hypothetical protein BDZ91DRAFT_462207 [Kalaharituber pfeilii]|nr:hypothetical protein BDZ91DRAFT_462207 [Kalaharituber pfeilii]